MLIKVSLTGGLEEWIILELQGNVLPVRPATSSDAQLGGASGAVDPTRVLDGLLIGHLVLQAVRGQRG